MKDFYTDNYKTPLKEIKENTNKCKDILCSWTIIKMSQMYPKRSTDSMQSQCNFCRIRKKILKFHMEPQRISNNQNN